MTKRGTGMTGKDRSGVWVVGCDSGAVRVEIPLFGPGAGSAASAGMTVAGAGMMGRGCGA